MPFQQSKARPHFDYVDGLRGLAAFYVVLHHAALTSWGVAGIPKVLSYAGGAVTLFIAISGFCLMLPVSAAASGISDFDAKLFLKRRARRILPPYYAALMISIAITTFVGDQRITTASVVSHLLLVHNLDKSTFSTINAPMWSIAVECQIYLLFPLLVAVRRRFGITGLLGSTYLAAQLLEQATAHTRFEGLYPLFLFVFALGMVSADFALAPSRQIFSWIGIVSVALMIAVIFIPNAMLWCVSPELIVGLCGMSVLVNSVHYPRGVIARFASWRPVAGLGAFSYSLYLLHMPIQRVIWPRLRSAGFSTTATYWIGTTVGTLAILIITYAFYRVFERPFQRARRISPISVPQVSTAGLIQLD